VFSIKNSKHNCLNYNSKIENSLINSFTPILIPYFVYIIIIFMFHALILEDLLVSLINF